MKPAPSVWTDEGSLKAHTEKQAKLLAGFLTNAGQHDLMISWAMRYGAPSIRSRLDEMRAAGCTRILVIPPTPSSQRAPRQPSSTKLPIACVTEDPLENKIHPQLKATTRHPGAGRLGAGTLAAQRPGRQTGPELPADAAPSTSATPITVNATRPPARSAKPCNCLRNACW